MQCPDCKKDMDETGSYDTIAGILEVEYECPECRAQFFGTVYRVEVDKLPDEAA